MELFSVLFSFPFYVIFRPVRATGEYHIALVSSDTGTYFLEQASKIGCLDGPMSHIHVTKIFYKDLLFTSRGFQREYFRRLVLSQDSVSAGPKPRAAVSISFVHIIYFVSSSVFLFFFFFGDVMNDKSPGVQSSN